MNDFNIMASKIVRYVDDHMTMLCNANPSAPESLNDRAADNWRPLLGNAVQKAIVRRSPLYLMSSYDEIHFFRNFKGASM